MHPIELYLGNFLGRAYPELTSNKVAQRHTPVCPRQRKRDVLSHKLLPYVCRWIFTIDKNIHSSTPPPTNNVRVCEHNVIMQAFPQEQFSHYTTGHDLKPN